MMNPHQRRRFLADLGFKFSRSVRHGDEYADDQGHRVLLGRDYKLHNERNFMADVKRVIRKREGQNQEIPTAHTPVRGFADQLNTVWKGKPMLEVVPHAKAPEAVSPETPAPRKRKTVRKFDAVTRFSVWKRIRELYAEGKKNAEIAYLLREEKFTMPGGDPIAAGYVNTTLNNMRISGTLPEVTPAKAAPALPAPEAKPTTSTAPVVVMPASRPASPLPEAVQWILIDPTLSDSQKIAMIRGWAQL